MTEVHFRPIDDELIAQVRDRIVEACRPEALYLFGSAARGGTHKDSDLDLLVVLDLPEGVGSLKQASTIHGLMWDLFVPMDIIVQTPEVFAKQSKWLSSIARVAVDEGILLYEKQHDRAAVE